MYILQMSQLQNKFKFEGIQGEVLKRRIQI